MVRFYGLSIKEVYELDIEECEMLIQSLPILEAREMLAKITIGDFPHLKKERRQKLHRDLHKQAFPRMHESTDTVSTLDLARILAGVKNG